MAERLVDSITSRFFLPATQPHLGRRRDEDLRPGVRTFSIVKGKAPVLSLVRKSPGTRITRGFAIPRS